ncbi:MAG: hypothetical protein A3B68_00295 [Candidatus Melainabacteria bacterium RIFCSPHIGHO2_02_FULL_34_12]|nr:MAG: hypothetical protein A3B68_00295 [Candidatus Melainabacteria bacterium RIFCSPHIGHO2_02_FULL_34_12]
MINKISSKLKELFGIDLRTLALFRICLAVIIIIDLLQRLRDLDAFYVDNGVFPRTVLINNYSNLYNFSFHLSNGSYGIQLIFFIVALIFAFCLLIGFQTKIATLLSWIFMVSLHVRMPFILIGGDELLRMILFWSIFLPLGARFSLDGILNPPKEKLPEKMFSAASVTLLSQILILYWFSVVFKSRTPEWQDGSAIYYALCQDHYLTRFGKILFQHPDIMKTLTHASFWFEMIGPVLLFMPFFTSIFRVIIISAFIVFQSTMGLCIELTLFPWVSSIAMLPYLPIPKTFSHFSQEPAGTNINSSRFINILVSFLFIYVLWWNLGTINERFKIPERLQWIGYSLRLDQKWSLYCPLASVSYWYVIPAKLRDGTEVDLFQDGKKVSWKKPDYATYSYKNRHWRGYMLHLAWFEYSRNLLFPHYCAYLYRKWNEKHPYAKQIKEIQIFLMYKRQLKDYKTEEPEKVYLWKYVYP